MKKSKARYFVDRDDSGHWYVVPVDRKDDWDRWGSLGEDDPAAWEAPTYARRVNGSLRLLTFSDPVLE